MKSLRDALPEYLAIRHALGTQLKEGGMALSHFLDFMEAEGAEVITLQIALRWAMLPADVQIATWARRLGQVRGFAAWRSSFDPRTEVPPDRMLGARRLRNPPHIYTEKEVLALMAGAAKLPKGKIRPWTYRTLLGLLAFFHVKAHISALLGLLTALLVSIFVYHMPVCGSGWNNATFLDTTVANDTTYYYVVSALNVGGESADSSQVSVVPTVNVPSPWLTRDLGAVGVTGWASFTNGVFTVIGSGADIGSTNDEFRFVHVTTNGDCTIVARDCISWKN